jgi:DNA-binding CsgD family transcriptional regulator/predicted ATPase
VHEPGTDTATTEDRTALIGRDDAVDHLARLVRRPDVRLVTVTGRSGVGKSALAETVARAIEAEDGVGIARAQVDRHTLRAGVDEVAAALTLPSEGPGGPAPTGRRRLVLLDGLEAVSGSAALVETALADDEGLTVLATSIVPLALPDEQLVRLEPLPFPGPDEGSAAALREAPAVRLLRTRIAEARADRAEDDLPAMVTLTRLLDGLPLALELAAARCAELPVSEVLDQVERLTPIGALAGEAAPEGSHRRDLRSTILWSYRLLDADDQRALRRLGVFAGSFGPTAVRAVTGMPADCVDRLAAAGLARSSGRERFELLSSVSLVARELLDAEHELTATEDRHAEHFLATAAAAAPELRSPTTPEVRRAVLADLDDIVAAVRHLDRRGRRDDALRLMVDIALAWEESSASALAAQLLGELLPDLDGDGVDPGTAAEAWALAAIVAVWGQRPVERRDDLLDGLVRAATVAERDESPHPLLMVLRSQVLWLLLIGRPDAATAAAGRGLELARAWDDSWWQCQFLGWSAAALTMIDDAETAAKLAIEGRDLALVEGDTAQILRLSHVLLGIDGVDHDTTSVLPEAELIVLAKKVDDVHAEGVLRASAAPRALANGDVVGAARQVVAALDLGRRRGLWYIEELALLGTVLVAASASRPGEAARVHGWLEPLLPDLERVISPQALELYLAAVDHVRLALGDHDFQRAVARGRLLDWEATTDLGAAICDEIATSEPGGTPTPAASELLSPRQAEVMALLAAGWTNKEIALELGTRPRTITHHTSEIYRRLGVRNRTEAVGEARRLGIIERSA